MAVFGKPEDFQGLSTETLNKLLQSPGVKAALAAKAARALPRTKAIALSAGATNFADTLRTESGTRPGSKASQGLKRPFVKIVGEASPAVRKGDRQAKLTRRQILRRGVLGG